MDERLFARLGSLLGAEAVVLASVLDTRGATPRKSGSRMLITATATEFSIGGGLAEAHVIEAAHALLAAARGTQPFPRNRFSPAPSRWRVRSGERKPHSADLSIDLTGRPGAVGVCGGTMHVHLRLWQGAGDRQKIRQIADELAAGRTVTFAHTDDDPESVETLQPNARLLIIGAGHCGRALHDLARHLDFDLWVQDARPACFADAQEFIDATCVCGPLSELERAFATARPVYAVLLNRDFAADIEALQFLANRQLAFLGMMGSAKRIGEVLAAVPDLTARLLELHAPVGIEIGAQSPHEIAVSILAQLIKFRRQ